MSKKIVLDKEELYQKYIVEGLSQKNVAKYFGCSIDTVVRNLKEYKIQSHKPKEWTTSNIVHLSERQKNIIYGAMLGDGSLVMCKNGINAQFCYTSKSKQHVEFVCNNFLQYSYTDGIKRSDILDKRTNKIYTRYTFRSISDNGFTKEYNKWYFNKIKHIPNDLKLNSLICLIWYIGDGCICNSSKSNAQYIKLATNCFPKEEQEKILIPQLSDFEARLCKVGKNKRTNEYQYAIYIPKRKMQLFFDYIGDCPFSDYKYKWNIKENKVYSCRDYYNEWEQLYLSGVGYTKIAKQYNVDNTTVLRFLQKNGIYKKFIGYKQFYNEWEMRYLNGETYSEIAKDYRCCTQTILHHLRRVKIYKEKGVIQDGQL